MEGINLKKEEKSNITLTHKEILKLIDEIKRFENKFLINTPEENVIKEFEAIEPDIKTNELKFIEVKHDNTNNNIEFTPLDDKPKKLSLKKGIKKIPKPKFKEKSVSKIQKKNIDSTTFKIRLNNEGNLVNLDIKQAKPNTETTGVFKLPKLNLIKKKEKKGSEVEKSMVSKLRGGIVHIGKLKKVIPFRRESGEETEESKSHVEE